MLLTATLLGASRGWLRYDAELAALRLLKPKLLAIDVRRDASWTADWYRRVGLEYNNLALRGLKFDQHVVTDDDLRLVAKLRRLESLSVPVGDYSASALEPVWALPELQCVTVWRPEPTWEYVRSGPPRNVAPGLGRSGPTARFEFSLERFTLSEGHFSAVALAPRLTSLTIERVPIRATFLAKLPADSPLVELNLPFTNVDDEALRKLAALRSLTKLNLRGTKASGAGLSRFKKLADVDLGGLHVTNATLDELKALPLTDLSLAGCQLDDGWVDQIVAMPMLERLEVTSRTLSTDDMTRFAAVRPKLRLLFPTLTGDYNPWSPGPLVPPANYTGDPAESPAAKYGSDPPPNKRL